MSCIQYFNQEVFEASKSYPTDICLGLSLSLNPPIRTDQNENACIGIDQNLQSLKEYWSNLDNDHIPCQTMLKDKIYQNGSFNPDGFKEAVEDVNYLMATYYYSESLPDNDITGHVIATPGSELYDSFSDVLINALSNNPAYNLEGVGQCGSYAMFHAKCTDVEISTSNQLIKAGGCTCQFEDIDYDVPDSCEPTCNIEQVIKLRDPLTGIIQNCDQNICIIDGVSINASASSIGAITINQLCPSCTGGQTCNCYFDDSIEDQIGIADYSEFSIYCGENSQCVSIDNETGVKTKVSCEDLFKDTSQEYYYPVPQWVYILCLIILLFAILVIFEARYEIYY